MEIEDYKRFELDWKNTLLANIIGILFIFVAIIYIFFTLSFISSINNDNTKIIALIVFMFSTIKIITFIGYPTLQYKLREKK